MHLRRSARVALNASPPAAAPTAAVSAAALPSWTCAWRLIIRLGLVVACSFASAARAQEQSVNPGVNNPFLDPDIEGFVARFEIESREVYARRKEIVQACGVKPGDVVADIGAGTGLFTRLFADAVGPDGRVIAVDIAQKFLDHILAASREAGQRNVETVLCPADAVGLPPESIDVAFICDTYHHFEFPHKTMTSVLQALKPGGRAIVVDFRRIEGESSDWVMSHVRAGQDVVEQEILAAGLQRLHEEPELMKENYFVVFHKPGKGESPASTPQPAAVP